jgi:hypothetical protein
LQTKSRLKGAMFDDYNIPDHMGDIQGDILACKTMSVSDLFSIYTCMMFTDT